MEPSVQNSEKKETEKRKHPISNKNRKPFHPIRGASALSVRRRVDDYTGIPFNEEITVNKDGIESREIRVFKIPRPGPINRRNWTGTFACPSTALGYLKDALSSEKMSDTYSGLLPEQKKELLDTFVTSIQVAVTGDPPPIVHQTLPTCPDPHLLVPPFGTGNLSIAKFAEDIHLAEQRAAFYQVLPSPLVDGENPIPVGQIVKQKIHPWILSRVHTFKKRGHKASLSSQGVNKAARMFHGVLQWIDKNIGDDKITSVTLYRSKRRPYSLFAFSVEDQDFDLEKALNHGGELEKDLFIVNKTSRTMNISPISSSAGRPKPELTPDQLELRSKIKEVSQKLKNAIHEAKEADMTTSDYTDSESSTSPSPPAKKHKNITH